MNIEGYILFISNEYEIKKKDINAMSMVQRENKEQDGTILVGSVFLFSHIQLMHDI